MMGDTCIAYGWLWKRYYPHGIALMEIMGEEEIVAMGGEEEDYKEYLNVATQDR